MRSLGILILFILVRPVFAEDSATPATRFIQICLVQEAALDTTAEFCEGLMVKSRLVQSDALRYLMPAAEKDRDKFAAFSTKERFDIVEAGADISRLVAVVMHEVSHDGLVTPVEGGRVAALILGDIMKPDCGPYQVDTILRTVDSVLKERDDDYPRGRGRISKNQSRKTEKAFCVTTDMAGASDTTTVLQKCLNGIFQVRPLAPSPNP